MPDLLILWVVLVAPPLLLVSVAVWLRFRAAVLRWSVAVMMFAAISAAGLWLSGIAPAGALARLFMLMIGGATWGSFFGAALRPFSGRSWLASVAGICVGILGFCAGLLIAMSLGLHQSARPEILGTDQGWGPGR